MKQVFIVLALMLTFSTAFSQDNLKVVKYIIFEALPDSRVDLETLQVPKGEVWRIESTLSRSIDQNVTLVINDVSYILQVTPKERFIKTQLPFYLPGGTEFQLGARKEKGIVSICVLKIE